MDRKDFGRRAWTRTRDPQLRRLMLYPPELRARKISRLRLDEGNESLCHRSAIVEQFIQGRKCLKPVSPKTLIWYQCNFKAFNGATSSKEIPGGEHQIGAPFWSTYAPVVDLDLRQVPRRVGEKKIASLKTASCSMLIRIGYCGDRRRGAKGNRPRGEG